ERLDWRQVEEGAASAQHAECWKLVAEAFAGRRSGADDAVGPRVKQAERFRLVPVRGDAQLGEQLPRGTFRPGVPGFARREEADCPHLLFRTGFHVQPVEK